MIRSYFLTLLFLCALFSSSLAQSYNDYLGAGHNENITVTTCSDQTRPNWDQPASGNNTINGSGFLGQYYESARFLSQATLGKRPTDILYLPAVGPDEWITLQMNMPINSMLQAIEDKKDEVFQYRSSIGYSPEDAETELDDYTFNMAWFDQASSAPDQLRHKVALALSEILVISNNSSLRERGAGVADFYDIFLNEAFGNYRDILRQVTLHPAMGFYLSHYNNPRADPELGTHPDENYAREVMQLFSIGLYDLNQDGSRALDDEGDFIPSYTQDDVKEFAKVFTGLGAGAVADHITWADEPYFGLYFGAVDYTVPMVMYDEYHEPGPKFLLNNFQLNGNQDGMTEVVAAVDHLFNHPNVAPFICRQLIQRLVKSNPSPGYISRISAIFNNNGQGVRGDMAAIVRAILMDDEARNCSLINHPTNGKLKEPIVKYLEYYRAFNFNNPVGYSFNPGFNFLEETDQFPMFSPSVFNFFTPDYQPNGPISEEGLVAPEFQILQTRTSVGFINWAHIWSQGGYPYWHWEEFAELPMLDITDLRKMARDPEVLINYYDLVFVNGQMSASTREIISDALYTFYVDDSDPDDYYYLEYRAELGLYLTLISPDYNILR